MAKRIFLFILVNFLVLITISLIISFLGIGHIIGPLGINYAPLFLICLIWGMGGSFISLLLSKWMARMLMGVQLVTVAGPHKELVETVHRLSRRAGLTDLPEVGIYQSEELNAFATGPSRSNSLIAVSTGLIMNMNTEELEGVLGHEISHIANGDMVTLTLIQGVLNAFVLFFSRVVAYLISQQVKDDDNEVSGLGPMSHFILVIVLDILFGILASIVVSWFSRRREFKADKGGADLAGKEKMIKALKALERFYPQLETTPNTQNKNFQSMQISAKGSFISLFSTHPPIGERIEALKRL